MNQRPIIYQMLPRLMTNVNHHCTPNGTIEQNGCGKLNDITPRLLKEIKKLGTTYVWLTGVIEHATQTDYSAYGIDRDNAHVVKGRAGSPYAIKDYYDIDPDLAVDVDNRMTEFEDLIERIHRAGMKVVMDFVPNHVARHYISDARPADAPTDFGTDDRRDYFFYPQNNYYYFPGQPFAPHFDLGSGADRYEEMPARATGNDCFSPSPGVNDWYETVKLNYGVDYSDHSRHFDPTPSTWIKMLHILKYWAAKGIDGFRCDMAFMVPCEFWQWAIPQVKADRPDLLFIAEIYDVGSYWQFIHTAGFDYLYDKVNLYDTLRDIQTHNHSAARLTECWQRLGDMAPHMLNFLENHDEQRFASEQYAGDAMLVTPSLVVAATFGTGAMMIYAGQELGEKGADAEGFSGYDGRTTIFDYWSVPALRRWLDGPTPSMARMPRDIRSLHATYRRVLTLCNSEAALREGGFFDLMYVNLNNPDFNPHRHFAYMRHHGSEIILIVVNFDNNQADIAVNLPAHAFEFIGIKPGKRNATELLSDTTTSIDISSDSPARLTVGANGAVMVKFSADADTN
ncbi:MAG: alpha-amylase family glycosyl hydrolase [Bacteroides sp.]|nr:alpha-amylase family glycosyl hydrolase [Bacteroides sp.]MCM1413605.1 alpha-amylase family glycosyl hydrolase [Bacteroides sp.]MCM1471178.1 alpha-amylase family glycosyl hydrolase [Bacteroides sp.]